MKRIDDKNSGGDTKKSRPARERSPLEQIPCVSRETVRDLEELGFHTRDELADGDPESMFRNLERLRGGPLSRDILAIFRCAVYSAVEDHPEEEKLRWWNWRD